MNERDLRIDFLRGLALLMIFIDHAPWNALSLFTLRTWSIGDASELFFFMSGYVAALVYGRTMERRGFAAAAVRIWRRGRDLYAAQIALLLSMAGFLLTYTWLTEDDSVVQNFRLVPFANHPWTMTAHALALRYQPTYLDILPTYIVFFAVLPFLLWLLRRNVWMTLALSGALYAAVQFTGWTFHTLPEQRGWLFDPFAWQFLFTLGAAFGSGRLRPLLPWLRTRAVTISAAAVAAAIAIMVGTAAWHEALPKIPSLYFFSIPSEKELLQAPRLLSFLALALLAWRYMPDGGTLARFRLSRAVILCGQQSLSIFSAGVLLAALASVVYGDWESQFAVSVATAMGVVILMGIAAALDWSQKNGLSFTRTQAATT
ncbi:MAG TPA: OpgC domain-containing protein [Rhizomicrobium sp.]|nr:OpgC domain-containing protein [Rhizomicrobium sp.]